MDETVEQAVRRLVAIEEIRNLKARYFRCVDFHHWDEFRELFTENLEIDFAESTSNPTSRDEFVASVRRHFETSTLSVHHGHNAEITVHDDDHANGIWPMFDLVEMPPDSGYDTHTGYGNYIEDYVRGPDGRWRIAKTQLTRIKRVVLSEGQNA
jgi:hypothetical protein